MDKYLLLIFILLIFFTIKSKVTHKSNKEFFSDQTYIDKINSFDNKNVSSNIVNITNDIKINGSINTKKIVLNNKDISDSIKTSNITSSNATFKNLNLDGGNIIDIINNLKVDIDNFKTKENYRTFTRDPGVDYGGNDLANYGFGCGKTWEQCAEMCRNMGPLCRAFSLDNGCCFLKTAKANLHNTGTSTSGF
jgi:hypothetical protein